MSKAYIAASLRRLVEQRANYRCEYCLLPGAVTFFLHEIDHVIAEKHGGKTEPDNLALTCWRCNRHKGSDLTSVRVTLRGPMPSQPSPPSPLSPWERGS